MSQNILDSPAWSELKRLNNQLQELISNTFAASLESESLDPWEATYDVVFSKQLSTRVYTALKTMNQTLEYYDPDTSYEEDVLAFANAVQEKTQQLDSGLESRDSFEP